MPRTGRRGRLQCELCRKAKNGLACEIDDFDVRRRCTYCVDRNSTRCERTFGREREQKNRRAILDLNTAIAQGGIDSPELTRESSEGEIARAKSDIALVLQQLLPSVPTRDIATEATEVATEALFSQEDVPLENIFGVRTWD